MRDGWFWFSTGFAAGGLRLSGGRIVEGPPILRKWIGGWPPAHWKLEPVR